MPLRSKERGHSPTALYFEKSKNQKAVEESGYLECKCMTRNSRVQCFTVEREVNRIDTALKDDGESSGVQVTPGIRLGVDSLPLVVGALYHRLACRVKQQWREKSAPNFHPCA